MSPEIAWKPFIDEKEIDYVQNSLTNTRRDLKTISDILVSWRFSMPANPPTSPPPPPPNNQQPFQAPTFKIYFL